MTSIIEQAEAWVVFQRFEDGREAEFIGVFTDRENAADACRDEYYVRCLVDVNVAAPHESTQNWWKAVEWGPLGEPK